MRRKNVNNTNEKNKNYQTIFPNTTTIKQKTSKVAINANFATMPANGIVYYKSRDKIATTEKRNKHKT